MSGIMLLCLGIIVFLVAYVTYGSFLAKKWGIDPTISTPAHTLRDDVDYCPADSKVVLGHHFSSIAGAGPITGPIAAIIFGWLPVFLWVIVGSVFIGGVHDWGSVFASVRHEGKSVGEVVKQNIGNTGKKLFDLFAWLALVLVVAAFTDICAGTFAYSAEFPDMLTGARAGTASVLFILLAMGFGFFVYRKNASLGISTVVGVTLLVACIYIGYAFPILKLSKFAWTVIMLGYIACASVMPVWILLQPRDYLCSFLLYGTLAGAIVGIFLYNPVLQLPSVTSFTVGEGLAAQSMFPFLFITVACGAVSGFHSLVGSGTTSKQINSEKDTKLIGYGAMLLEGLVAIIAIISVAYLADGGVGSPAQKFAAGIATFMGTFGVPFEIGQVFITLTYSAFALTSLDTATRIARYMFQELFDDIPETSPAKVITKPVSATFITIGCAVGLLMYGYARIWPIFGASNQLLAGLSLLALSAWFAKSKKISWPTLIPMVFMFAVTLTGLVILIRNFFSSPDTYILGAIASALFILAIVLIVTSAKALTGKGGQTDDTKSSKSPNKV